MAAHGRLIQSTSVCPGSWRGHQAVSCRLDTCFLFQGCRITCLFSSLHFCAWSVFLMSVRYFHNQDYQLKLVLQF